MPLPTLEKEGRYLLALNAYRNGQFRTTLVVGLNSIWERALLRYSLYKSL